MAATVLVVEDSRAMREYVESILERAGDFVVEHAESGFHALQALPRVAPDLIITDVNMPEVSDNLLSSGYCDIQGYEPGAATVGIKPCIE